MAKLKQPRISEETDEFIEFEIPEGKREEYDLPEGCFKYSNGQDFSSPPNFYEYFVLNKSGEIKMDKELKNKIKKVAKFQRCKHLDNSYCKKIKHDIISGIAVECHCFKCKYFEE